MEIFGRYILLERIGMGGMAEVHRGVAVGSAGFARPVAVKRILPHLTQSSSVTTMLVQEAKLAASLSHPSIIRVLDLGQQGQSYFIAMDYVAGRSLTQVMLRARELNEPLPLAFSLHVAQQALRALNYAHRKEDPPGQPMDIIHRDVSPDNVMVAYDGNVYLMDFGIARAADQVRLTLVGSLKGKPAYMSPEVVKGEAVTQAVDLFAMAVVLHEMMTLQPMREPKSDMQMLNDVARGGFPTFESMGVQVPAPVAQVIYRALQDTPEARYESAEVFVRALEAAQAALGLRAGPEDVSRLLSRMFPTEIQEEQEKDARHHRLMKRVRNASPRKLARLVAEAEGDDLPRLSRTERAVLAAAGAAMVMGVGGGILWARTRDRPAPPVAAPTAPPAEATPAAPRAVRIPVSSQPSGARVQLDGANHGQTPLDVSLREGQSITLTIDAPGFLPFRRELAFASAPTALAVTLEPEPAAVEAPKPTGPGFLTLQTRPWGRVVVDGKDTGTFTPLRALALPAGRHVVEVVNDQLGISTRFTVSVESGRTRKESRTLR